jgi:hypothetical protein
MFALAFIFICFALALIASGMYRHQRDPAFQLLQRFGSPSVRRCAGFVWLVCALLLLTTNNTLSHALVEWLGLFSVASLLTMGLSSIGKKR